MAGTSRLGLYAGCLWAVLLAVAGCQSGRMVRLNDEELPPPPLPASDDTLDVRGQDAEYGFEPIDGTGASDLLPFDAPPPATSQTVPPPPNWQTYSEEPPWHRWFESLYRPFWMPCGSPSVFDGRCPPGSFPVEYVPFANTWAFAYYDGFELPANDYRNAGRFGVNWASPLVSDYVGLGVQAGASGSVTEDQEQVFITTGVFYRGDMQYGAAWNVGAVVDFLHDGFYDVQLVQVRGKVSYTVDFRNELGVWGAAGVSDDDVNPVRVAETVGQVNLFWRHLWNVGLDSEVWVGWRDGQSDADESNSESGAAIGARFTYPLTDYWALAIGGHTAFESDTWNVWAGVRLNLGGRARQGYLGQNRHAPLFSVADNTTMTLAIEPR